MDRQGLEESEAHELAALCAGVAAAEAFEKGHSQVDCQWLH